MHEKERKKEREGVRRRGIKREIEFSFIPGLVYTSKKSPAAMEKSPKVGRSHGFTSGMLILAS